MGLTDALLLDPYPFEIFIAKRTDGVKGSGTLNDPYDASTATAFDAIMNNLPGATLVHLGPGEFQTNGYSDQVSGGWQMRPGMRIVGSGMTATTLKLVNASTANAQYFAIGHSLTTGNPAVPNPMDFCEVSDLTIDCNLQSGSSVACGAIRLMGNHVKMHRVRAINWGTTSSTKPCFVLVIVTADRSSAGTFEAVNAGIDRCVAEQPAPYGSAIADYGTAPAITVLHVGGKESAAENAEAYGRASYIRNSFVDCASLATESEPDRPRKGDIRALSMGWCRAGIVEGNQIHNVRIGGPYQDKATSREIVVRNNSYRDVIRGPHWKLGVNSGPTARNLSQLSNEGAVAVATLTDHGFQVDDRVKIDAGGGAPEYKGVFLVKETTANEFKYQMQAIPQGPAGSNPTCRKVFGCANILIERNIIELAQGSGDSVSKIAIHVDDGRADSPPDTTADTPDYVHTEAIVRENRIRYVDVRLDPTWSGEAIRVSGVKNAIVRDNVIECAPFPPRHMKNFRCGTVKYFNNKTPAGVLIQGYNGLSQLSHSELETESEDALVLTLI